MMIFSISGTLKSEAWRPYMNQIFAGKKKPEAVVALLPFGTPAVCVFDLYIRFEFMRDRGYMRVCLRVCVCVSARRNPRPSSYCPSVRFSLLCVCLKYEFVCL
jgi:hypothetical protein